MAELPRGTVTFLFTDIEGSTRLLESLGSDYTPMLGERVGVPVAELVEQLRRPLDVGEQERDSAGRAFHPPTIARAGRLRQPERFAYCARQRPLRIIP